PADIAGRRLRTDLVVLTGCGTSGGALTFGEGIQGLVAPFLEAGARAVVATLWDVGDAAVIPTVRRFYESLATGATAAAALRTARLGAWRAGESPAIWAALTLTGDSRVVPLGGAR
ncbi:MAG: CHAT domain-containing protein, partial [Gemmatimonadales bacterium]|nr:CHAT domain-containing protein [Gemmatimonadales bacterium]